MKEFFERFKLPSPEYWVKLGNTCLVIGVIIGTIGGAIVSYNSTVGTVFISVGSTFAAVGKVLSMNTVVDKQDLTNNVTKDK